MNTVNGVLIADIFPGGPADKAGLKGKNRTIEENGINVPIGGDFIIKIDNKQIKNGDDMINYIQGQKK